MKNVFLMLVLMNILHLLQAYDQHLNMILGDVEETVTTIEIDEETYEEIYKVRVSNGLLKAGKASNAVF